MDAEIWDVFTRHATQGNALAVVWAERCPTTKEMQRIAFEFGLSETVFVEEVAHQEPAGQRADARLRIFTPTTELDIAGHPTLGAAHALRRRRRDGVDALRLTLNVGPVDVRFEGDLAWMNQGTPTCVERTDDRSAVARALGLGVERLHPDLPIEAWSVGTPFLMVPLVDPEALASSRLDLASLIEGTGLRTHAVLAFVPAHGDRPLASRGFTAALGIPEDPATGSAHGPLAAYLVEHGVLVRPTPSDPTTVVHHQGVHVGRPSTLHVRVTAEQAHEVVWIGGEATRFMAGGRLERATSWEPA